MPLRSMLTILLVLLLFALPRIISQRSVAKPLVERWWWRPDVGDAYNGLSAQSVGNNPHL